MKSSEDKLMTGLPESLRTQFAELERRLWVKESIVAVSGAAVALAGSYLLLFFSDRFWDTPSWLRVLLVLAGVGLLGAFALRWYRLWVWRRRDLQAFALLVQKHYGRLGDRLLGIVELADESKRPENISAALCRAAIKQVAEEAGKFDFREVVDVRQSRTWLTVLSVLVAVLAAGAAFAPQAFLNAFQRWAAPATTVKRFTFVRLEKLPTELIVPHGEPFEVIASVDYRSVWHPEKAAAFIADQLPVTAQVSGNQLRFTIPGQTQRGRLELRIGDARQSVDILPTYRPAMKQMSASVALPEYLRYPALEEAVRSSSLDVLEGSQVIFHGLTSRALKQAELQIDGASAQPLNLTGEKFETAPLKLDTVNNLSFRWQDNVGLSNAAPWLVTVQTHKDAPPKVELPDLAMDLSVLEDEVLKLRSVAQDDYGVRELGIVWQVMGVSTNFSSGSELQATTTTSQEKKFEQVFRFNPTVLRIPPDSTVELQAVATDFYPGRKPSESPLYRLHVVGFVKHAEMVRQQLESLFARLEEVTRREEAVASKTRDLKNLPEGKLSTEEAAKQIGEQADEQAQNARNLEQTSREGMKTLREALRNPTFSDQVLREWSKNLQSMQDIAKGEMQKAGKSLQSAQDSKSERPQQLAEAQMSEEQSLRELERLQKNVNQGLDNLQAQTLAQRLRKLAEDEKKVQDQIQTIVPETIGLLPRELPEKFQKANTMLAEDQVSARERARQVQEEMSRFYDRTQRPDYGEVSKQMKEANTPEELSKVGVLIRDNIAMQAMQGLGSWSKRFEDWANILEPKTDSSPSSAGKGGQPGAPKDDKAMKELMALIRMREQQSNIQERTQLLEGRKAQDPNYADTAKQLAQSQFKLRLDLGRTQAENEVPGVDEPLEETFNNMHQAENLLSRPQTDTATDQTHAKSVNLLSDVINLINEQAKRNNNSSSSSAAAAEMEFMLQMVAQQAAAAASQGMKPGSTPGMNMNGGTTDRRSPQLTGDARGSEDVSRTTTKGTGTTRSTPVEFREALENYFRSLERNSND